MADFRVQCPPSFQVRMGRFCAGFFRHFLSLLGNLGPVFPGMQASLPLRVASLSSKTSGPCEGNCNSVCGSQGGISGRSEGLILSKER